MSRFPYQFFDQYIFRTSLFSLNDFLEKTDCDYISDDKLINICYNPVYQEAIYLASPYLYREIEMWMESGINSPPKKTEKLRQSIIKYYNRMSTRSTPFGLFAGVGLGSFGDKNYYSFNRSSTRDTKLDMQFLVSLSQTLEGIPCIKNKILYFPNNSIYTVGRRIRYIEYEYLKGKRQYIISSAPRSKELDDILDFTKTGKSIDQLVQILINEKITPEDAIEFVDELISNQVLVSELEPNVSGKDFFNTLIKVLKKSEERESMITLMSIREKLEELDLNIGNSILLYQEIEELIKTLTADYNQKYLFQTDLYFQHEYQLPKYWKKELKAGIAFLNKIKLLNKESVFEKFKKAFSEKFEKKEVSLAYVMDTEIGIGYRNDTKKGLHSYLDDIELPHSGKKSDLHIKLNPIEIILNQKIQECLLNGLYVVQLSDEDFKDFEENWSDLPDTFSIMSDIISEANEEKLFIYGGGSSAANLSARFCSDKSEVRNLTKSITDKEKELNSHIILAEIVHLPEARIGNVIRRSLLRDYEIPYLASSTLPKENQITIDDLYVSLKNDEIVLRSKRLNKEVKPYLTNAHNYSSDSLPVYHFLSDLPTQAKCSRLGFYWGDLEKIYRFLPRVEYKNIILAKAQWQIRNEDINELQFTDDELQFLSAVKQWREKRKIPQWVQWIQGDNTLTLNLANYEWAKLFIDTIHLKKSIVIEEFLHNEKEDFAYQFVFSLYKDQ